MAKKETTARVDVGLLLDFALISTLFSTRTFGVYENINPLPKVDKSAHGHAVTITFWWATTANMLAGIDSDIDTDSDLHKYTKEFLYKINKT